MQEGQLENKQQKASEKQNQNPSLRAHNALALWTTQTSTQSHAKKHLLVPVVCN